MSFAIDANILIYASNEGSQEAIRAKAFLTECARGNEMVYVPCPAAMAYLRIVTHPRILRNPLAPEVAMGNLEALFSLPHVRLLSEQSDVLMRFKKIAGEAPVRGNLVPDAHIAVILLQHKVRVLYTNDADFRRFAFLDVRNPL